MLVTGGKENNPVAFAGSSLDAVVEDGVVNDKVGASFTPSVLPNENVGFDDSLAASNENAEAVLPAEIN